jgi:hypothetical protein
MAGDVVVSVVNGDLTVRGDAANNAVIIEQVGQYAFKVQGIDRNGATRVNGSTSPRYFYNVTDDLDIALGNGSDGLRIGSLNTTSSYYMPDDIRIDMGNDLAADGVVLSGFALRDANDRIDIHTGGGDDAVIMDLVNARVGLNVNTGAGRDTVNMTRVGAEYLTVDSGSGNDSIVLSDSHISKKATIYAGAGNDNLTLKNFLVHSLYASMGSGNDDVTLQNANFGAGSVNIDGGTGSDFWEKIGGNRTPTFSNF